MKKSQEIADQASTLNKAALDEPIFILRANDPLAPQVVRYWAHLAATSNAHDFEKCKRAADFALEMEDWQEDRREAIMAANNPKEGSTDVAGS